jgi:hypothetical protein
MKISITQKLKYLILAFCLLGFATPAFAQTGTLRDGTVSYECTPVHELIQVAFALTEKNDNYYNFVDTSTGYIRFGDFYRELKKLYLQRNSGEAIYQLYEKIIAWCEQVNTGG